MCTVQHAVAVYCTACCSCGGGCLKLTGVYRGSTPHTDYKNKTGTVAKIKFSEIYVTI